MKKPSPVKKKIINEKKTFMGPLIHRSVPLTAQFLHVAFARMKIAFRHLRLLTNT